MSHCCRSAWEKIKHSISAPQQEGRKARMKGITEMEQKDTEVVELKKKMLNSSAVTKKKHTEHLQKGEHRANHSHLQMDKENTHCSSTQQHQSLFTGRDGLGLFFNNRHFHLLSVYYLVLNLCASVNYLFIYFFYCSHFSFSYSIFLRSVLSYSELYGSSLFAVQQFIIIIIIINFYLFIYFYFSHISCVSCV